MKRDKLFLFVIGSSIVVIVLFGAGSVVLALATDVQDKAIVGRVIGAFTSMFTAVIGFAVGYLVGHGNGNGKKEIDA